MMYLKLMPSQPDIRKEYFSNYGIQSSLLMFIEKRILESSYKVLDFLKNWLCVL